MASRCRIRRVAALAASGLVLAGSTGCWFQRDEARPLTADAFVSQRVEGRNDPEPIDRPGQVITEGVKPPVDETATINPPADARGSNEISPVVKDAIRSPGEKAKPERAATTAPAKAPPAVRTATTAPDPSGQYVVLGTVLARVNTRPIFAHKLLAVLDNALRAEAQQYDAANFKKVAAVLISKEIDSEINNELVFAVAEKALDEKEKQWADVLTAQWKNEQITKAGGSEEMAKRRFADEGWDFNDRLDQQYRVSMAQVFYQRRVLPLVHVTATEMRQFYEANRETMFTQAPRVKFRVIKIDPRGLKLKGGRTEAEGIAAQIREKVTSDNFEQLAREKNDPVLVATGGLVGEDGWITKGTYVAERVEDAMWKLQPGEVTPVIEEKNAFYIAKLEEREDGTAREFDDPAVQKRIEDILKGKQFDQMRVQRQNQLLKDAVIQRHPQMLQIALDMAMQRYARWAEKKPG